MDSTAFVLFFLIFLMVIALFTMLFKKASSELKSIEEMK